MYSAMFIAKKVVEYSNEKNIYISNLKLQKILYYIQAAFLVEKGKKCFKEPIKAWQFGPVIENVYYQYRIYGREPIIDSIDDNKIIFDDDSIELIYQTESITDDDYKLIKKVVESYQSVHNPFELVQKTHSEDPWKNTPINNTISTEDIKKYYSQYKEKLWYKDN